MGQRNPEIWRTLLPRRAAITMMTTLIPTKARSHAFVLILVVNLVITLVLNLVLNLPSHPPLP